MALTLAFAACSRVEGTGRRQLLLTSQDQENQLGAQAYQEVLAQEKPSGDAEGQAMVERVGRRLAAVAPNRGFQYEFKLIESATINAFCLPGGKVAIYTGILPYCQNEAGLAAVMGHEIAHAIARHGGERMTHNMVAAGTTQILDQYLQTTKLSDSMRAISLGAFGLGAQVGAILPFSRAHETEADDLGMDYMARAGYDPNEAVAFWGRFAQLEKGDGTPSFLRTHPASADRAADLKRQLPEALRLYNQAPQRHGAGPLVPARYRAAR